MQNRDTCADMEIICIINLYKLLAVYNFINYKIIYMNLYLYIIYYFT